MVVGSAVAVVVVKKLFEAKKGNETQRYPDPESRRVAQSIHACRDHVEKGAAEKGACGERH